MYLIFEMELIHFIHPLLGMRDNESVNDSIIKFRATERSLWFTLVVIQIDLRIEKRPKSIALTQVPKRFPPIESLGKLQMAGRLLKSARN